MFEGFANVWTPVLPARVLRGEVRRMRVAGETLVLFRDERDGPRAFVDRSSSSSPSLPEEIPEEARLPVREALGFLWIFTGRNAGAEAPVMPAIDPARPLVLHAETWPAPWARVMEALLDPANLPFTWALGAQGGHETSRRFHLDGHDATSARLVVTRGDLPVEPVLVFRAPASIELFLRPDPAEKHTLVFCVPETETTTHVLFCAARALGDGIVPCWITDWFATTELARERASAMIEQPLAADDGSLAAVALFRRSCERTLLGARTARGSRTPP